VILLDTSVLSEAFRRHRREGPSATAIHLTRLIRNRVDKAVPGIVLQELLTGVPDPERFDALRKDIEALGIIPATGEDHALAAQFSTRCRARGVAATAVDCLIAAQTVRLHARLYTLDRDFARMAPVCDLSLYRPGPAQ
jgi:predicted nucleic acid-binding protein